MGSFRVATAVFVVGIFMSLSGIGDAQRFGSSCKYENFFGQTSYYQCPRPGDSQDKKYCCGRESVQQCCDKLFGVLDDETVQLVSENIGAIAGITVLVILLVIASVLVCCCCCSCCLLNKMRKKRNTRANNYSGAVQLTPGAAYPVQQQAQAPPPVQQQQHQYSAYPQMPQQGSYPSYPPNQSYPAYPNAGYPMGPQPPYPMPENPPPYSDHEKQLPYNPNYHP